MSTSPLGLNNYLCPPEIGGRQPMLKVHSPLIQTSELMLPQTVESSDNLFPFTKSLSDSETPKKPISTINRFVNDDSELESTSEADINRNISETTEEPQTHPSTEENLPNNPLSELHPRLGKQLIQTQSRIMTTTSDKIISPQTLNPSENQSKKHQSDYLPIVQARWESDVPQPISEPISVSQRDVLSRKKQPKSSSRTSPEALNNPSSPTVEPQQFIQEKSIDSTTESPRVESSQTSPETLNNPSSPTVKPQQFIQEKSIDSTTESPRVESSQTSPETLNNPSSPTVEPQQFIQEKSIDSTTESPRVESSQTSPETLNNPSSPTVEPQQFIQEKSIDSTTESPRVESLQNTPETLNEVFPSSKIQSDTIQQQAKDPEYLSSLQSNKTETIQQQTDNQSLINKPSFNPENLTNPNLIQSHSPLIQQSDFIQSQLINEFIETPQTSESSTDVTSLKTSQISEPWSNQFDLIDESVPVTDNIPESWSNLTELLNYDNFNLSSNSQLISENSQSIKREQKQSIPDGPASVSSSPTQAEKVMGKQGETVLIDEEQLEMLARKVYNLLRQQLERERENHDFKTDGSLPWLDIISSTTPVKASGFSSNSSSVGQLQTQIGSTVSLVNYKLQILTRKVYQLLQFKIETERERLGFYYRGNKPL